MLLVAARPGAVRRGVASLGVAHCGRAWPGKAREKGRLRTPFPLPGIFVVQLEARPATATQSLNQRTNLSMYSPVPSGKQRNFQRLVTTFSM